MSRGIDPYERLQHWNEAWSALTSWGLRTVGSGGRSSEGRPLPRYEFGQGSTTILLSSLLHGVEWVGGLALLELAKRLLSHPISDRARFVVLPEINPDGVAFTAERRARGAVGGRRTNARGVDLNRNFPPVAASQSLHPFAGSRFAFSPYFSGAGPLSEPETQFVASIAAEVRPIISLSFHSFGSVLLYPWAHTRLVHPEQAMYLRLGAAFTAAQPVPYRVLAARQLYPTSGDLDDWLDAAFGTRAFTIEVGHLDLPLRRPRRWLDVFAWMNPIDPGPSVELAVRGALGLIAAALEPSLEATNAMGPARSGLLPQAAR